jgi:hypothetical protein
MEISFGAVAAAFTTVLSLALALRLLSAHRRRPRTSHIFWAVAFALAAVAAACQFVGYVAGGFDPVVYRLYLLSSASVPGFMGAGTVYLLWRRVADAFAAFTVAVALLGVVAAFTTPLASAHLRDVTLASAEVAKAAPGTLLAVVYALQGALGGVLALVVGALYSYLRTKASRNLLIALGGLVFAASDTAAAYGGVVAFFPAEILGILLLFYGVVYSQPIAAREGRLSA